MHALHDQEGDRVEMLKWISSRHSELARSELELLMEPFGPDADDEGDWGDDWD